MGESDTRSNYCVTSPDGDTEIRLVGRTMDHLTNDEQTIVLHIHEHLGPFRDRLSKVEAVVDAHSKALNELSDKLQVIGNKVDSNHLNQIKNIHEIKEDITTAFTKHSVEDKNSFDFIKDKIEAYNDDISKLKWMVLGGSAVVSFIVSGIILYLEFKSHMFP